MEYIIVIIPYWLIATSPPHIQSLSLSLSMQIKKIKCEKKLKINLVGEFKRISCIGLLFTLYLMLRLF